jgi:NADPH-dependent glutamate synthase beta subunit-like oxidoreductase/NAD(P)H-flavin reductase
MESLHIHIPGFLYEDLHNPERLADLTKNFYAEVHSKNPELFERFDRYKVSKGIGIPAIEISSILVEMGPYLGDFVARMFGVEHEYTTFKRLAEREHTIFAFKKEFFVRRALKKISANEAKLTNITLLDSQVEALRSGYSGLPTEDPELATAVLVMGLLDHERMSKTTLQDSTHNFLSSYITRLKDSTSLQPILPTTLSDNGLQELPSIILSVFEHWLVTHYYKKSSEMNNWITFRLPNKVDYQHLVDFELSDNNVPEMMGHADHYRYRDGFDLTDSRYSHREAMSEIDYCILCHERDKDSCSKGFTDNKEYKKNPLGYTLKGCPLGQKISESHMLESHGETLAALAVIMIDNPMCPGTGHRICNDCMKACIYQKQDPVNIPQAETRILTDILNLPWGFEIYSLLTRWNPLNVERPHMLPYNGKKILAVGMGPAGYTLSHYFLNEGFGVVGIDGLKIEPLPVELVGDENHPFKPLKDFSSICQKLGDRVLLGFGGVSEYGITVRWDKNFLTVIYLNLLRRKYFALYDGIRFGGTITVEEAWDIGFDHICFATGAGKPTFVQMENNLLRGIRKASDFLMALQLTGAGKRDSMANLQVQLPAIVIGGGLTAIDTATEVMAYYPIQVTKIRKRYDQLCQRYGKTVLDSFFDKEEQDILKTYLVHAEAIDYERNRAARLGEQPNFIPLLRKWGGVHLYYRKNLQDSPAYRLNHEEIIKSLEEGIFIVEKMSPVGVTPDEFGSVKEMIFEKMENVNGKWKALPEKVTIPAKAVLIAAGTVPNIMYEREHPETFVLDEWGEFFQSFNIIKDGSLKLEKTQETDVGFFTSYQKDGKYISFYGDNHPVYEGNVVKAMASAKVGYKQVMEIFRKDGKSESTGNESEWNDYVQKLDFELKPHVIRVERLTPTIIEVIVHAPQAAKKFKPGQFFRLQNYEVDSLHLDDTLLMMEGVALTGAWVDVDKGLLSMIILEMGASSRMCSMLKPGQRVVVMGPTGAPTEVPESTTALLLGGGLGNAVLFSIAKAFKEKNCKVVYFAGYKKKEDFFKQEEIEAHTDVVVYSVDSGSPIQPRRPQDRSFVGNIVQAMIAYAKGELGDVSIPLDAAERIIAIGSDRMMAAVTAARHTVLKPYLNEQHIGIASINSPMQCMMKAICAQCLQRHIDKETGKEKFVFSCVNQDQCMDEVDFEHLHSRLRANTVMEKITSRWFDYLVEKHSLEHV